MLMNIVFALAVLILHFAPQILAFAAPTGACIVRKASLRTPAPPRNIGERHLNEATKNEEILKWDPSGIFPNDSHFGVWYRKTVDIWYDNSFDFWDDDSSMSLFFSFDKYLSSWKGCRKTRASVSDFYLQDIFLHVLFQRYLRRPTPVALNRTIYQRSSQHASFWPDWSSFWKDWAKLWILSPKPGDYHHYYSLKIGDEYLKLSRDSMIGDVEDYLRRTHGKEAEVLIDGKAPQNGRELYFSELIGRDLTAKVGGNIIPLTQSLFKPVLAAQPMTSRYVDKWTYIAMATNSVLNNCLTTLKRVCTILCAQKCEPLVYSLQISGDVLFFPKTARVSDLTEALYDKFGKEEIAHSFYDVSEKPVDIAMWIDGEAPWSKEFLTDLHWNAFEIQIGDERFVARKKYFWPNQPIAFTSMTCPIEIKTVNGSHTVAMLHTRDITVAELKKWIHRDTQILPEEQSLIYKGMQLEDRNKLSTYDVQEYDTIYMIILCSGGARRPSTCPTCKCSHYNQYIGCCGVCRTTCRCAGCERKDIPELELERRKASDAYKDKPEKFSPEDKRQAVWE
jgi:Ubiquitin family